MSMPLELAPALPASRRNWVRLERLRSRAIFHIFRVRAGAGRRSSATWQPECTRRRRNSPGDVRVVRLHAKSRSSRIDQGRPPIRQRFRAWWRCWWCFGVADWVATVSWRSSPDFGDLQQRVTNEKLFPAAGLRVPSTRHSGNVTCTAAGAVAEKFAEVLEFDVERLVQDNAGHCLPSAGNCVGKPTHSRGRRFKPGCARLERGE